MRKFRFLLLIPLLAAAPYAAPGTSYGAALQEAGAQESAQQEGATTPPAGDIGDEGESLEIFGRWRFLPELSHDVQERFQFPMKRDRHDEEDARAAGGRWETIGSYEDGVLTLRSTIDMGGVSRFGYQLDPETGHLIATLRVHPRVMSQPFTVRRVYERDESSEPAVETPEQARDSN